MNLFIDLSVIVLTSGAASALFLFIFKTYFKEKISASIKSDYDHKIESFKSDLSERQSALVKILESQTSGYNLSQNERITSIKIYWDNYLKIREYISVISSIDGFITEEETNNLFNDQRGVPLIANLREASKLEFAALKQYQQNIELVRPFLNDEIWVQTAFLVTFLGRILYLYDRDLKINTLSHWKSDEAIMNTAKDYLSEKEFQLIVSREVGGINLVKAFVEQKILSELSSIVNGRAGAKYSMEHAVSLGKLGSLAKGSGR